jgi:hypothetical protein
MLFCSMVASNFLAHGRVLAESLRQHHPDACFQVFVVDAFDEAAPDDEPFERIGLHDMGLSVDEMQRRTTMYDAQALISSLKPRLLMSVVERSTEPVLFLDADMLAFGRLEDVFELAARHGIVLSPHATVTLPFEPGGYGPEQLFIRAGVFNGGFLGVSPAGREFLSWWDERCARECLFDPARGLFASQTWLSLVPALFEHCVLRDRGVNLTGHGIGSDDLSWRDGEPWIDGSPLRLFHFAGGFDPRSGELGGPRAPASWVEMRHRPGIQRLCAEYARLLLDAGYDGAMGTPWRFGSLPDGAPIDWAMRAAYREGLIAAEAGSGGPEPPNPFADGAAAFTAWLGEPRWPGSEVSRYLAALRAGRADLLAAFPEVPGSDERGLVEWVAGKYPAGRLPDGLPTAALAS